MIRLEAAKCFLLGCAEWAVAASTTTRGGTQINTASIARLNATARAALAPLTRRGRRLAHGTALLQSGLWLVGTAYNFCWTHESLRLRAIGGRTWQQRTPAMAAGLTDHVWTMDELLRYRVPPVEVTPPPRRSRPPTVISLAQHRRAKARVQEAVA